MRDRGVCTGCRFFVDDPSVLERELPGLTILSSASGASRGDAGICRLSGQFQLPERTCSDYRSRSERFNDEPAGVTRA